MAFLEPEYSNEAFVRVTDSRGESTLVPAGYEDLQEGDECEPVGTPGESWFYRLSAPGYMDCTDWSGPFASEQEARDDLSATYDCDPDTGDDLTAI